MTLNQLFKLLEIGEKVQVFDQTNEELELVIDVKQFICLQFNSYYGSRRIENMQQIDGCLRILLEVVTND